ncbi:MAG: tRNA 2-selenouridine(34) synthase MnmH [Cellulosilyticaceae bacterium]
METTYLTSNFKNIVINNTPLIDVRAPIEFQHGAFKTSINLPIMNNEERHLVGTCYKQFGNDEATKLGFKLVSGQTRDTRIKSWIDALNTTPNAYIYCHRGGSRSQISQNWIENSLGMPIKRLDGGYKAFRSYLIENGLTPSPSMSKPILLGGYTGSGKTLLLKKLTNFVDLEHIANHRGSSFGHHTTPQPSQISFENNLAYAIIQHQETSSPFMIIEDEGRHIGNNYIPKELFYYFNAGSLVVLHAPIEERISITHEEYVVASQKEYIDSVQNFDTGMDLWLSYIKSSIRRLEKRLGNERLNTLLTLVDDAYKAQLLSGDNSAHRAWIEHFLVDYYDPMYAYQLKTTTKNIIFEGNKDDVYNFLLTKQ